MIKLYYDIKMILSIKKTRFFLVDLWRFECPERPDIAFFRKWANTAPRNGERPVLATPAFQLDPPVPVDGPAFRENDTLKRVVPSREDGQSE